MKIAIISDIHNNITNLKKVLDYCNNEEIKTIICCGDLAAIETLDFLNDNFSGEIYYCFGNMDDDFLINALFKTSEEANVIPAKARIQNNLLDSGSEAGMTCLYKNTRIFKDYGEINIDKKKIAFTHYPEAARELCGSGKYDFAFYGHTHKPWVSSAPDFANAPTGKEATANQGQKKCTMLNPGNVAGEIYPPTFAVWDTENNKFELIRVHDLK